MQPTRAMRARMANQWAPGMAVDIVTADSGSLDAVVVGPATTGDSTQLRVRFPDGTEEDRDASAFRSPRDQRQQIEPKRSGSASSTSMQQAERQARSDENEVSSARTPPLPRSSSYEEVVQRQQQEDAEASIVTAELAAWLRKRDLLHRAHVIAASLEASGAQAEEWIEMLDGLVSSHGVPPHNSQFYSAN